MTPGSAYNIQNYLEMEGVFAIKATPIGGNCCLLEELEVGFIGDLNKEGESWWKSLFSTIEKWEVGSLDGSRDMWFRIYGVPLHVWCPDFFVALGELWGRFVCMDDNTSKGETFDVARILVNIPLSLSIPEVVLVCIDGAKHNLCIREDAQYMYRQTGGIKKAQSSVADSSDSSDSEFERLMVESTSGCSDEGEGLEANEGPNPNSGGSIEKGLALPDTLCVPHSGDLSEEVTRGKMSASFVVKSGGHNSRLDGSDSRSDFGLKHSGVDSVLLKHLEPEVGVVNSLETRSRSTPSGSGQSVLKGENGDVLSGERHYFGVVAPSEPTVISDMAISSNAIPYVREVCSVRNSGLGSGKEVCSESGPDGDKQFNSFSVESVRAADFINFDRSKAVCSETNKELFRSGMLLDPKEATVNVCSDYVSVSANVGGLLRDGLSKASGAVAISCSDSIEDSINCLDGASGSGGVGPVALKINSDDNSQSNSGKEFQYGGRGGRKSIRKVSLVHE